MNAADQQQALLQVRQVIERLILAGTVVARADGTVHPLFPVAVSAAEGEVLRDWVTRECATNTIEVGLGYGISALFICEGLLKSSGVSARHVVLDPSQATRFSDCGLQLLSEAGVRDIVEYHPQPSERVLPSFLAEKRCFDFAFVDGNHRFDGVFVDLFYLGHLVRPGSIVFVDDYQLEGVRRAASFFLNNLRWTLEEVSEHSIYHQWAVLRTAREPVPRAYDYFVDF